MIYSFGKAFISGIAFNPNVLPLSLDLSSTKATVGKLQLASRMRLSDVNFVAFVLNRNVTQKIKIILYEYVISFLKLFHLLMYFGAIKQVYIFIALSTKVIPTVMTNRCITTSKNPSRIIFPEL